MEKMSQPSVRTFVIGLGMIGLGGFAAVFAATSDAGGSQTGVVLLPSGQTTTNTSATTAAASATPIVFNFSQSAKGGDIVYLQGHDFGAAPKVYLDPMAGVASWQTELPVLSKNENWLAVKLPQTDPGRGLMLRIVNGSAWSNPVRLNLARPQNLDALAIVPGNPFRIFGRNLVAGSKVPTVTVDGVAATVDMSQSNETMLMVTAPASLAAKAAAKVRIDNGTGAGWPTDNNAGWATVEYGVQTLAGTAGLPFGGSIGWTATFTPLTRRVINVSCATGVGTAVQQAINSLSAAGGGTVHIGAGTCALESTISLANNVLVEGSGQKSTILRYSRNTPVWAQGLHHTGLRNLTLSNAGGAQEGVIMQRNQYLVLQNVTYDMGTQRQSFMDANRNMWVANCYFNQSGSIGQQSPFLMSGSQGLVFENNAVDFTMGASAFERVSDSYIGNNDFQRFSYKQDEAGALHMLTIDFASRIAVVGNRFKTEGGAITRKDRNDGESILTEAGGGNRTETLGTVQSATTMTVTDPTLSVRTDPFWDGRFPDNYGIAIVAGRGTGQTRYVRGVSNGTATIDAAWAVIPDATSKYAIFVWGLEKTLLKGNSFSNMPRGIWLYQSAIRDVDVLDNNFSEGGGIYLRAYQNLGYKMFDPMYNIRIAGNRVVNTTGVWASHMSAIFVNSDAKAFGTAYTGVTYSNNSIVANKANVSVPTEEYAGSEGYFSMMRVENYSGYESMTTPRILGTIFQNNRCDYCDTQYRIGTGSANTIIAVGSQATSLAARVFYEDWKTTSSAEQSLGTLFL